MIVLTKGRIMREKRTNCTEKRKEKKKRKHKTTEKKEMSFFIYVRWTTVRRKQKHVYSLHHRT